MAYRFTKLYKIKMANLRNAELRLFRKLREGQEVDNIEMRKALGL